MNENKSLVEIIGKSPPFILDLLYYRGENKSAIDARSEHV